MEHSSTAPADGRVEYEQVAEVADVGPPPGWRRGLTSDGYTARGGCATAYKLRLVGERVWRRIYCLQFSNAPSFIIRRKGQMVFLPSGICNSADGAQGV